MRYQIIHTTTYTYDRPVTLLPHVLRLRPRCDVMQSLREYALEIDPKPMQRSESVDLDGNAVTKVWFSDSAIDSFHIKTLSIVETHCTNPFNYLLEPFAFHLPIDYPASLSAQLQPYRMGNGINFPSVDPIATQFAQELWHQTNGDTVSFVSALNQAIYTSCRHMIRETGDPFPASITWQHKEGSCRDLALLFMETCRAIGLAARFVSGYREGDLSHEDRHLHAWAEVYLPGAGWRGYDPTEGLAVADRHIALVASASSRYAAPIVGAIKDAEVRSKLDYHLSIKLLNE